MKKLTKDEVEKILFEKNGYKIIGEYKDFSEKTLIEKDGYKAYVYPVNINQGQKANFFGIRNEFCNYNFNVYIKNHFKNNCEVISSKYCKRNDRTRTLLTLKCECGKTFERVWDKIYYSKSDLLLCKDCLNKLSTRRNYKNNIKTIENNGYKVIEERYINNKDRIEVVQKSTGYKGYVCATNVRKKSNFVVFSMFTNADNYVYNANRYAELNKLNVEILSAEQVKKTLPLLECRCSCGEIFYTTIGHIQEGKTRCNKCSARESKRELKIKEYLLENNIKFIQEYKFNDCFDTVAMPFDFHLTDYDILIEVDGEQHFEPVRFGGMSLEDAEYNFKNQKRRDKIKDDFCKRKNIPLLRIKYVDIDKNDNYKQIINDFIHTAQD